MSGGKLREIWQLSDSCSSGSYIAEECVVSGRVDAWETLTGESSLVACWKTQIC